MADPEGFLARWSRLKREPVLDPDDSPTGEPNPEEAEEDEAEPLPPIDSLGADSDYTRFLAAGVPEEVKRLALRKAWVSDPKIAEFRGFGEYDWDFNAPGYGQLLPTDDIQRMVEAVFRHTSDPPPESASEPLVADAEPAEAEEISAERERNGTSGA